MINSVPSLNGLCCRFYRLCWDIICSDLLEVVLDYFRVSAMPRGFQSTLLVRLLKKPFPSLCNVSNKDLTKLLMLRFCCLVLSLILRMVLSLAM